MNRRMGIWLMAIMLLAGRIGWAGQTANHAESKRSTERIMTPMASTASGWWKGEMTRAENTLKDQKWADGLSKQSVTALQYSLAIGFCLLSVLNFVVAAGCLMWLGTKIARMPDTTFRRAVQATVVEAAAIGVFLVLVWYLSNFFADGGTVGSLLASGITSYVVIALVAVLDILVLRLMYKVGWLHSVLLSAARLAALALICAALFGIGSVLTVIG
jgi:hypothetical protein